MRDETERKTFIQLYLRMFIQGDSIFLPLYECTHSQMNVYVMNIDLRVINKF